MRCPTPHLVVLTAAVFSYPPTSWLRVILCLIALSYAPSFIVSCPTPGGRWVVHRQIALDCLLPDCLATSATCLSCVVHRPLLLCYPTPACTPNNLTQFDCCFHPLFAPAALPPPNCCPKQQLLLSATVTIKRPHHLHHQTQSLGA